MVSGSAHNYAQLDDVRLHYLSAGAGDTVVLMHGFLGTSFTWRDVMPKLAERYHVIAPDLRGLGDSTRPASGYDKHTVGEDVWKLVTQHLGIKRFFLVGDDLGAMAAFALTAAHPDAVRRLAFLDAVVPGDGRDAAAEISQDGTRWHLGFAQVPDLPEAFVLGREAIYLNYFWKNYSWNPVWLTPQVEREYLRTYSQPGAFRAGFELYRAIARDAARSRETIARGKISVPLLAVGGGRSMGRGASVAASLRRMAIDVEEVVVPDCGHFIAEEQPAILVDHLLRFFGAAEA